MGGRGGEWWWEEGWRWEKMGEGRPDGCEAETVFTGRTIFFFFFFKFKNSDCASAGDGRAKSGDRMCKVGSQVLCKWLGSAIHSGDDY